MIGWYRKATRDQPWTWAGHAAVTTQLPVLPTALTSYLWDPSATVRSWVYIVGVLGVAAYYMAYREPRDEEAKRAAGTWDKPMQEITGRDDRVGDNVGPATAAAALVTHQFCMWDWRLAAAGAVVALVFTIRAGIRAAQRMEA